LTTPSPIFTLNAPCGSTALVAGGIGAAAAIAVFGDKKDQSMGWIGLILIAGYIFYENQQAGS
jgi:hypothetical protein